MGFCKLEISDTRGYVGGIYYLGGYQQAVFLRIEENFFSPEYEEEGETDVYGNFIAYYQMIKYRYSFTTYCNQYLAEALVTLKVHDSVQITLSNGLWGNMKDIEVSVEEVEIGCLAAVTVTFCIWNNDIIKTGGCNFGSS
jgi:hypothetical protein